MNCAAVIEQQICQYVSPRIGAVLHRIPPFLKNNITEIRLRTARPLIIAAGSDDTMIASTGEPIHSIQGALIVNQIDVAKTLQIISQSSLYALENEIRAGFITIAGGHRVGLAGEAFVENGQIKSMKHISSLTFRIARESKGMSDQLLPWLIGPAGKILSTLIISPPRCGKTTMIRDIVRQLSWGVERLGVAGMQIGIVDERSEICACRHGCPTMDIGPRTDILDCCPKAQGMLMLIRTMAPQVVVTDELGREEDTLAVMEALNAGVSVIATVHGRTPQEVQRRPYIGKLVTDRYFDLFVTLSDVPGIGTVKEIMAADGEILFARK